MTTGTTAQVLETRAADVIAVCKALANSEPHDEGLERAGEATLTCGHCDGAEEFVGEAEEEDADEEEAEEEDEAAVHHTVPRVVFRHAEGCVVGRAMALLDALGVAPSYVEFDGCARYDIPG